MNDAEFKRLFDTAKEFFHRGEYRLAETILFSLVKKGNRPEILELLGYIAGNRGDLDSAFTLLTDACAHDSCSPEALYYLGKCCFEKQYLEDSVNYLRKSLAKGGDRFEVNHDLALSLCALNQFSNAAEEFEKSARLNPDSFEVFFNLGRTYDRLGRQKDALDSYTRALNVNPKYSSAWNNKAVVLSTLGSFDDALYCLNRALEIDPDYAEAWCNHGIVLSELDRPTEALVSYQQAIKLNSDYAEAWTNLGVVLNKLHRYEEALQSHALALDIKPDFAEAWSNRGISLSELHRNDEALYCHARAIELQPSNHKNWCNQAIALEETGLYSEALASYDRAIEIDTSYAEARYNRGLLLLKTLRLRSGFRDYLWRWLKPGFSAQPARTSLPTCFYGSFSKKIFLWGEQGIGDEIFYAGMLKKAERMFDEITLLADVRLHSILQRSFPKIQLLDSKKHNLGTSVSSLDCHAPIGNLGYILGIDEASLGVSREKFLLPNPEKTRALQERYPFMGRKKTCGISWRSSNPNFGKLKSMELDDLMPLLGNSNYSFVNLQYGEVEEEIRSLKDRTGIEIITLQDIDLYNDIDTLLSVIVNCDFIVTTSNVTAHLAGSVGKRGCVLVPCAKGRLWYWHLKDVKSRWYPSLHLFYQQTPFDWSKVVADASKLLNEVVK